MAVKKNELYSSLWASCDALRGGMDASQYKDYILTLLFMKYVTDKFKGQKFSDIQVFDKEHDPETDPEKRTGCSFDDFIALKNKNNIGEGMDKIIARLAEVNTSLKGVIDIACMIVMMDSMWSLLIIRSFWGKQRRTHLIK